MPPPTSTAAIEAVARAWEVEPAVLIGPGRDATLVEARDAALILLTEEAGLTASAAARRMGRTPDPDYVRRARDRRWRNGDFAERLEAVRRELRGEPARCPHCGAALGEARRGG
jgi:hypothetical protein